MDNRSAETPLVDPTQLKSGKPKTYIRDPEVAHEAANTVKPFIDEKFPLPKESYDIGVRSKYADELHTDVLTKQVEKTIAQEQKNAVLEQDLMTDKKTGLGSLIKYEKDTEEGLKQAIAIVDGEPTVSNIDKLSNFQILRLDINFLGYANDLSGGHAIGDIYIQAVADIIGCRTDEMRRFAESNGIKFEGYRLTKGDELAVMVNGNNEQARLLLAKIKEEVSKLEIGPDSKLPAGTSVVVASGSEFIDSYTKFEKDNKLSPDGFCNRYAKFLDQVADFRSDFDKLPTRLEMLTKLYKRYSDKEITKREYENLKPYVTKGALGITDYQLNFLLKNADLHESIGVVVNNIMQERYKTRLRYMTDPLQRFIYQAILDTVR